MFYLKNHIKNNFIELITDQKSLEHNNNHVYYVKFKNLKIKLISFHLKRDPNV